MMRSSVLSIVLLEEAPFLGRLRMRCLPRPPLAARAARAAPATPPSAPRQRPKDQASRGAE
eukprot:11279175-Alexandrium_andersonii.AAC.1